MKRTNYYFGQQLLLLAALFVAACSPGPAETVTPYAENGDREFRQLDTLSITAPPVSYSQSVEKMIAELEGRIYQGTYEKRANLVHTVLDISFNWEERSVPGQATLTLTPWFYDIDRVRLDAKTFELHQISLGPDGPELEYDYDGVDLYIHLDQTYSRGDTFELFIDYEAFPYRERADGFQPARIQRGIFFINHTGEQKHLPRQIWTQGQTEYNSNWFPTIDRPNVRTTQEMFITVEDDLYTLTNGVLVGSEEVGDGLRRDHFKLDLPHPPYLFMLAIGENYTVVEDEWNGIPLEYIVEEEYEEYAADIFGNTHQMFEFFTEIAGMEYPWPRYSQITVRDFVAGAMENTTAVIFGEQVQRPLIDLRDRNNDAIVAHELIHHWFGNIVTCENWASLTLNEGFASFTETLWQEHFYGPDAAGEDRADKRAAYFNETTHFVRPLLNFEYEDNEEMFDRHSYNKGGLVLQMLRHLVGDEAFFASWQRYLKDNQFSAVEVHDLRLAFEEVTGKDLNIFFDQWFFQKGHPVIQVSHNYDSVSNTLILTVEQIQSPVEWYPVFQFPVSVDIHLEGGYKVEVDMHIDRRKTQLLVDCPAPPVWINFDVEDYLLAEVSMKEERDMDSYLAQYQLGTSFSDRYTAARQLRIFGQDVPEEYLDMLLEDPSGRIRNIAMDSYGGWYVDNRPDKLIEMARGDENTIVRANALRILEMFGYPAVPLLAEELLEEGYSAAIISAALEVLYYRAPEMGLELAANYEETLSSTVLMSVASIYASGGGNEQNAFFRNNYHKLRGFAITNFFTRFSDMLKSQTPGEVMEEHDWLLELATDRRQGSFVRYGATTVLTNTLERFEKKVEQEEDPAFLKESIQRLERSLEAIVESQQSPRMRSMIENLLGQ